MHIHALDDWRHEHVFIAENQERSERRAYWVIALTVTMMIVEILSGWLFNSMALLADGWHMTSHAAALCITVFAYWYARRHLHSRRYTFGPGKIGVLGGFTSGVVLGVVALLMVWESVQRFFDPLTIRFDEAIAVAALGLIVNLVSAWLLHERGHHDTHHHGHHEHALHHKDHNLRAAFLHVMADALTSVLAIIALLFGKMLGWIWMDPMMGIVGALVIGHWTYGLLRDTSRVLLDADASEGVKADLVKIIEADADNRVADLHVWRVGPQHVAAIVSIVTHFPRSAEHYKELIRKHRDLAHITIEVNRCTGEPCLPPTPEATA